MVTTMSIIFKFCFNSRFTAFDRPSGVTVSGSVTIQVNSRSAKGTMHFITASDAASTVQTVTLIGIGNRQTQISVSVATPTMVATIPSTFTGIGILKISLQLLTFGSWILVHRLYKY